MSQSPGTPSLPQFVWICPKCGRKVPNRLNDCRCGFQRDAGLSEEHAEAVAALGPAASPASIAHPAPASAPGASASGSIFPWVVLGVVALAVFGGLVALQVMPQRQQPQNPPPMRPASGAPQDVSPTPGSELAPITNDPGPIAFPESAVPLPTMPATPSANGTPVASFEDVVSSSLPAVVSIETAEGRGSGFFAAPRTVITNRHVVSSNVSVTVRLSSGATLPGRVDVSSQDFDLAIVHVDGASASQSVLPLGSVNNVRPGQEVIAIGLALGVFQNTVTRGIISAIRRAGPAVVLQTDAAINSGNSGGPLLNRSGQVIGVNALKISGSAESLGFAIAIDHAKSLLDGGRPSESTFNTPPAASEPLAPAFGSRSSTDEMREAGARAYDQTVRAVAERASQLDDYWNRIKANCSIRLAPGYDREWFGLWDGRTELTAPDPSCVSAIRDLNQLAVGVRTTMANGQEVARRASVAPGDLRDIRHRYRMDWVGFDR